MPFRKIGETLALLPPAKGVFAQLPIQLTEEAIRMHSFGSIFLKHVGFQPLGEKLGTAQHPDFVFL